MYVVLVYVAELLTGVVGLFDNEETAETWAASRPVEPDVRYLVTDVILPY